MSDPRDQKWEDRADKAYSDLTYKPKRTLAKWFFGILAVFLVIGMFGGAVAWIGSWGGEAKRITSPANVREQNTAIIDDWENLQAAAQNVCGVKDSPKQDGDPTLIEDPAFAYKATYRRIEVDYNRRMNNLYEAQAVRQLPLPSNLRSYPKRAPTLKAMEQRFC